MDDIGKCFSTQFNSFFGGNGNVPQNNISDTGVNMTGAWSYLVTCLTMAVAQQQMPQQSQGSGSNIFTEFARGVQNEVQAAKHPIEAAVVGLASDQCANVKKLFGIEYDQIDNKTEPDLNKLSLMLFTPYYNTTYSLGEAARYIPHDPQFHVDGNLVIFIHGFTDSPSQESFSNISSAFSFAQLGNNVVALDGSSLIQWLYLRSTTYVRFMGERLGETLAMLVQDGLDPKRIHLIGHSLGAHVAGFTGRYFQQLTGLLLGRISGLDPAGPCFSAIDPDLRLSYKHAAYVDVIHTDAGVYGLKTLIGHADYFPNKGEQQPNCLLQSCSHSRAWLMFAETVVNRTAMPAVSCPDWAAFKSGNCDYNNVSNMGFASKPGTRGVYYSQTRGEYPFGLGLNGLYYHDNEAKVSKFLSLISG